MGAPRPKITPYLYYPDATEAVRFLCDAFGFEEVSAIRDEEGTVWTATLRLGEGLVMVGPGLEGFGTAAIAEGALVTSRMFVIVDDVDAHRARAGEAPGATIVAEVQEHGGGHRQYIVSDCGGQQWIFAQPVAGP